MFKEINKTIRDQEQKHTYILAETVSGTYRLRSVVTGNELDLSFLSPEAAEKFAKRNGLTIT